jgi:putative transposase
MKTKPAPVSCKLCGSNQIVKFGHYRGIQRWWCKECRHKFADNDAIPRMKTPAKQVALALNMYFEGIRLNKIPRLLSQQYGVYVSGTSVYNWVFHFSQTVSCEAQKSDIKVGNVWTILETTVRNDIKDTRLTLTDVLDLDTRFLLASGLSDYRNQYDIKNLIGAARDRARKIPREIITSGWQGYEHGIKLGLGEEGKNITISTFQVKTDSENLKGWYMALNDRDRIIRGLKKKHTIQIVTDGWSVHYNFVKRHPALNGRTPGEMAGAAFGFRTWKEIIDGINQNSVRA